MKSLFKVGLSKGKEEFIKGKLNAEHAIGLGQTPNVVPPGEADIEEHRTVEIGWHPVPGGQWIAKTALAKMITDRIHNYPDPTQHWAVIVGDYCHQLWMDEDLDIIYINEKLVKDKWTKYEVGKTKLNDEAVRQAGEMVIFQMREKQKAYNLISNNCQNFASNMLDAVQVGKHKELGTSLAVYQRVIGKGKVSDLFLEKLPEAEEQDERPPDQVVEHASQVMDETTPKLGTNETPR
ncbi:hypothetical protein EV356DRAFT_497453 [Viridothelium virens]|uniref:Uncharacterized protein n=1 Tax=Viridothelium virens TaxID=1048519 RepID=A0A6A6GU28_VIRVR|nr:hypothetical protein EV356DRAFT_497453 [Viridothelium virens]